MSLEEVKQLIEAGQEITLPQPQPFKRTLPPQKPYPVDALGAILGGAVQALSEIIKAPVPLCAQGVLGATALTVQAQVDVRIEDRTYPTSCFLLSVGESGERKSAIDTQVLRAIRQRQQELQKIYDSQKTAYLNEKEAWEHSRREALKAAKDLAGRTQALKELGPAPAHPLSPIIIAEEPTYEGLVLGFEQGQPSMGLFSDEGGRMFGGYAMNKDNQLKTASGLSSLWGATPISRSRREGTILLPGRRLSLHLMMQGVVMQGVLSSPILTGQGLTSRCLIAWPESTAGTRIYTEASLTDDRRMQNFHAILTQILKMPYPLEPETVNTLPLPAMALDSSAKSLWIQAHDQIEQSLGDGGELATVRALASKSGEHILRIAANLAFVENPSTRTVQRGHIEAAIEIMRFYLSEALRIQDTSATHPDVLLAEKTLNWLRSIRKTTITLQEVYQNGPKPIRDAKTARRIISLLEEHFWVFPVAQTKAAWRVHDGLF